LTHGWGDSLILALALKIFSPPEHVAQFLGLSYEHGSHGKVLPVGTGDWTLRFYESGHRGGVLSLPSGFRAAAAIASRAAGYVVSRAGAALGFQGTIPRSFDPSRLLSPYFCGLHVVLLDLAFKPQPGVLSRSNDTVAKASSHGVAAALPVAFIPLWVCAAATTPVAGRHTKERAVQLKSSCVEPPSGGSLGPKLEPTYAGQKAARSLATIKACRSKHPARWVACVQRSGE
jgi:hypothetical protein